MRTGQEFEEDGRVDRQIAIETPWARNPISLEMRV